MTEIRRRFHWSTQVTTHIVEIRRRNHHAYDLSGGPNRHGWYGLGSPSTINLPWEALTRKPCTKEDAAKLVEMVGPEWETRIIPIAPIGGYATERMSLVTMFGSADQIDRHMDGYLGDEDIMDIARFQLYAPFETPSNHGMQIEPPVRWGKLTKAKISHRSECSVAESWKISPSDRLTGAQWFAYRAMRASLPLVQARALELGMTVSVVLGVPEDHKGTCGLCGARASGASVALTIGWGALKMVREYVL